MQKQSYRFIGGTRHNTFHEVETSRSVYADYWSSYRKARITMKDAVALYEEECFVDATLTNEDAADMLREYARLGKVALRLPKKLVPVIETKPLPIRASSLIAALGYNAEKHVLDVTFKNGVVYRYSNVGVVVVGELTVADSLGSAYGKIIRNKFPCTKLGEEPKPELPKPAPKPESTMFKAGDTVECFDPGLGNAITAGKRYTVLRDANSTFVTVSDDKGIANNFFANRFKLVGAEPRKAKVGDTIELLRDYFGQVRGSRHVVDRLDPHVHFTPKNPVDGFSSIWIDAKDFKVVA